MDTALNNPIRVGFTLPFITRPTKCNIVAAYVAAQLRFAQANGATNAAAHVIRNGGLVVGC